MKPIFKRREQNKLRKIIDESTSVTAEDFQKKMDEVKRKIHKLFDGADQNEEEE